MTVIVLHSNSAVLWMHWLWAGGFAASCVGFNKEVAEMWTDV